MRHSSLYVCIFYCLVTSILPVDSKLAPPNPDNAQEFHQLKLTDFIPISSSHLNVHVKKGGAAASWEILLPHNIGYKTALSFCSN